MEHELVEAALEQPCVNTHCHIVMPESGSRTLPEFLKRSYLNWQFKDLIRPDMDLEAFLDKVSCNSYFYAMAGALGELYAHDKAPLSKVNWREIQEGLAQSGQSGDRVRDILERRCGYRAIVLDSQNDPGDDNGRPDLFRSAFRCDMFLKGHPQAGLDLNGNDPRDYMSARGELTFEEYLDAAAQAVREKAARGAVALKLAIAYERGLDFEPAEPEAARRGWYRRDAVSGDVKAFEDMVAFHLCRCAGEVGIPVQIHTGMGKLERSSALWLKPLLDGCPHTKFVLLHCSYPHTADAMALLHEYNNVSADLSWLPLLSPDAAAAVLSEVLDVTDAGRIGWGCDAETLEESLGAHRLFCRVLGRVLAEKAGRGYYSPETCRRLVRQILYEGPASLYGIER